jgi:hypothetical protein
MGKYGARIQFAEEEHEGEGSGERTNKGCGNRPRRNGP